MSLTISRKIEVKEKKNVGRNDPCPCGSGKKYKKCHLGKEYTPGKKEGLISVIVDFLSPQPFFKKMTEETIQKIFGHDLIEEKDFESVMEAVIFGGNYKGQTPFEYFLKNAPLSDSQKQLYRSWQEKSRFSFFEVLHVNLGVSLEAEDLLSGKVYRIYEHLGTYGMENGMVLATRIAPFEDNWILTGGTVIPLPKEMAYIFKRAKDNDFFSQLEFLKIIYARNEKSELNQLSHVGAKKMLKNELKKRAIDFDIEKIEKFIRNKGDFDQKELTQKLASGSKTKEEFEYLNNLLMRMWHTHPKFIKDKTMPGPLEQILIRHFMQETHDTIKETPEDPAFKKKLNSYQEKWLDNPQKELNGKTPREVILLERRDLGNPQKEIKYSLSVTPMPSFGKNDKLLDEYDKALDLMLKKNDYLKALKVFSVFAENLDVLPEPFRYFCNVGVCLIQLGEMELGKKYLEKALALHSNYPAAENNLKNFLDPETIKTMRDKGKQTFFFGILKKQKIDFDANFLNNEFLKDAVTFLKHILNNKVYVSKIRRDIRLSNILEINIKFIAPDPEITKFSNGARSFSYKNREEIQFTKINYLHNITLAAGLIDEKKERLIITPKAEEFLELSPDLQFKLLFCAFFEMLDWSSLNRGYDIRDNLLANQAEIIQNTTYNLLSELKNFDSQEFNSIKLLTKALSTKLKEDKPALALLAISLDKLLIQFLVWANILKNNFSLLILTSFGKQIIEDIERSMNQAIPTVYYKKEI